MKILIVSQAVWTNENNSGNTLSNIFKDFDAEFANIYFSEGIPNNTVCKKYYQVTDKMLIENFLIGNKIGKKFTIDDNLNMSNYSLEKKLKKHKNTILLIIREVIWKLSKVHNKKMKDFIDDFNPDIIYAPMFGNFRMQRIIKKIKEDKNIPLVGLVSDDIYNYKKNMNIIEKMNQHFLRKRIAVNFSLYDKVYTMTSRQKKEYENLFNKNIEILRKNGDITLKRDKNINSEDEHKIKMIYAGGLYLGRDIVLAELIKVLKDVNKNYGLSIFLNIYTSSLIDKSLFKELNTTVSKVNEAIKYEYLLDEYSKNDIALHVESFVPEYVWETRLSFSTKIVDCLQSGCAILAIGPKENAGLEYLKEENAAYVINKSNIKSNDILYLYDNLKIWKNNAFKCLIKNHSKIINTKKLKKDLEDLISSKIGEN